MSELRVPIDLLRRVSALLFDHLETLEGNEVPLDKNYFWAVTPEQLYDVVNPPSDLTIGQLSECLANLEALEEQPQDAISYALVWLADVLRAAGHSVVR